MAIPEITSLQFVVLRSIGEKERPGRYVRERLGEEGVSKSLPAFYQLMSRMEAAGLVTGHSRKVEVADQIVTERAYRLTGKGRAAHNGFIAFAAATPALRPARGDHG